MCGVLRAWAESQLNEPRGHSIDHASGEHQPEQPPLDPETFVPFPDGFEEDDDLRSEFIRQLARASLSSHQPTPYRHVTGPSHATWDSSIPRTLVRF